MKKLFLSLLLALSACGTTTAVTIPTADVHLDPAFSQIKGKYNAVIQTGGWSLIVESETQDCSLNNFDANLNDAFQKSAQQLLQKAVEKVTFSSSILTPAQMTSQGYDGQIVLHQGNASSKFKVITHFFSADARSEINLDSILAISGKDGTFKQYSVTGTGSSTDSIHSSCKNIGSTISQAGQIAISSTMAKVFINLRDGLREKAEQKTPPAKE